MAGPLILARTFREAHRFAHDELGLKTGYYRIVNSVGTIKAVRGVKLYLVPGWDKRPDRFVFKSAMRFCRLEIVDVAAQQAAEPVDETPTGTPAPDPFAPVTPPAAEPVAEEDHRWADTSYTRSIAERYNSILVSNALEAEPTPEPEAAPEPAEKPKAKRRSRCKTCGNLHYKDEACPPAEDA